MKMNKTGFGWWITLCAMVLTGCLPTDPAAPGNLATPQATFPTLSLNITKEANPSTVPPTTTLREPNLPWQTECIMTSPTLDTMPEGVVVIQDQGSGAISLFDLQTGTQQSLARDASGIMAVSPDRHQLAYTYFLKGPLEIVNSQGQPVASRPLSEGLVGVIRWIDMDTLLMEKFAEKSHYYHNASSIIYNFKTGEQRELLPNYPGIDLATKFQWGNYRYTRTVYDPSFSRVIYPGLVLWDMNENRSIIELHQGLEYTLGSEPQWSRDGSFFIAAIAPQAEKHGTLYMNTTDNLSYQGGYDLWRVSRDGDTQRLTTLTTQHYAGAEAFALSPDEKHIAFWLVPDYDFEPIIQAPKSLAILDIESRKITNLCIPGGESSITPIWSPDGKYLTVSRFTADESVNKSILPDVLLIDLERRQVARIAEGAVVKGWMVK